MFDLLLDGVWTRGNVRGHTEGHSDMVRSFILYLSIFSTNQDRASAHFAFFNWFVPVSQVQPRLTSSPNA